VTNRDARSITRIDAETGKASHTIRLEAKPWEISYGHGRVWVTTQRCGSMGC
jgi:hypothetical protein